MADDQNQFALWSDPAGGEPGVPAASAPSYALAGWWSRAGALFLDALILLVPLIIIVVVLHQYRVQQYITIYGTVGTQTTTTNGAWLDGAIWLFYAAWLLGRSGARNGQTLGNQATRIRVMRNDGKPVDLWTVIVREGLGKAVIPSILFAAAGSPALGVIVGLYALVNYLWPLWERESRALHDLLAGTHVVHLDDGKTPRFSPAAS